MDLERPEAPTEVRWSKDTASSSSPRAGGSGGQPALRRVKDGTAALTTPARGQHRMQMAGTGLLSSRTIIAMEDFDRSRAFYEETLGLSVYREYGSAGAVTGVGAFSRRRLLSLDPPMNDLIADRASAESASLPGRIAVFYVAVLTSTRRHFL